MGIHQKGEFGRRATPPRPVAARWSLLRQTRGFAVGVVIAFGLGAGLVAIMKHASRKIDQTSAESATAAATDQRITPVKSADAGR